MIAPSNEVKTCNLCGKEFYDLPESGRCNECCSLKTRLYRQFAKSSGDERRQWDSLSKEQRQVFYSQWHGQVGIDMKAAISETMHEATRESKKESSTIACSWLDDFQLQQRYLGREEQIDKIKNNSQSMVCNIREVTLWADPHYSSSEVACSYTYRGRERELSASEVSRPQKKPRVDAAAKSEAGTFTQKQLVSLDLEKSKLEELLKKVRWTIYKANLPALSDNIKKRDRDQLELKELKVRATPLTLEEATKQQTGDFKEVKKEIAATRSATNPHFSRLKQSVAEAEKDLDQEGAVSVNSKMEEYEANLIISEKKDHYVAQLVEENMDEADTELMTLKLDDRCEVEHDA